MTTTPQTPAETDEIEAFARRLFGKYRPEPLPEDADAVRVYIRALFTQPD